MIGVVVAGGGGAGAQAVMIRLNVNKKTAAEKITSGFTFNPISDPFRPAIVPIFLGHQSSHPVFFLSGKFTGSEGYLEDL